jgi:hypothetical protein
VAPYTLSISIFFSTSKSLLPNTPFYQIQNWRSRGGEMTQALYERMNNKKKNVLPSWAPVAHTCNPSYSGGRDQEKKKKNWRKQWVLRNKL